MEIEYKTDKKLPADQLHNLFMEMGWSDGSETPFMLENFNAPFINSTVVVSAWDSDKLVGCIRALSDKTVRSIIHDLAVATEYQNRGIGTELVERCIAHFPNSEWIVGTTPNNFGFYERFGMKTTGIPHFLRKPSKWF